MESQELLKKVQADYDKIAQDFSKTRQNLTWPEIDYFKQFLRNGQSILDAGCGNGRLLNSLNEYHVDYRGLDNSANLLKQAQKLYPAQANNFVEGELFALPFADHEFDIVFCLAAFHHLPSKELRLKALAEMKRVLKKDGLLLMTNWYVWQKLFFKNILTEWTLKNSWNDFFIPWRSTTEKINRYYHGFTKAELTDLFVQSGFEIVEHAEFKKRNWLSVLKRWN